MVPESLHALKSCRPVSVSASFCIRDPLFCPGVHPLISKHAAFLPCFSLGSPEIAHLPTASASCRGAVLGSLASTLRSVVRPVERLVYLSCDSRYSACCSACYNACKPAYGAGYKPGCHRPACKHGAVRCADAKAGHPASSRVGAKSYRKVVSNDRLSDDLQSVALLSGEPRLGASAKPVFVVLFKEVHLLIKLLYERVVASAQCVAPLVCEPVADYSNIVGRECASSAESAERFGVYLREDLLGSDPRKAV